MPRNGATDDDPSLFSDSPRAIRITKICSAGRVPPRRETRLGPPVPPGVHHHHRGLPGIPGIGHRTCGRCEGRERPSRAGHDGPRPHTRAARRMTRRRPIQLPWGRPVPVPGLARATPTSAENQPRPDPPTCLRGRSGFPDARRSTHCCPSLPMRVFRVVRPCLRRRRG
jgi:hypothetical protein